MSKYIPLLILVAASLSFQLRTEAVEDRVQRATELNNRAIDLGKQGQYEQELKLYDEALALEPESIIVRENRCIALANFRRFPEALADADELIRREPYSPEHRMLRGDIYLLVPNEEKAFVDFEHAYSMAPDNLELLDRYILHAQLAGRPGLYHYLALRRRALENWSWTGGKKDQNLVYPLPDLGPYEAGKGYVAALTPVKNEIRLHGRIVGRDTKRGLLKVEVVAFGLPNGHFKALPETKVKTVRVGEVEGELGGFGTIDPLTLKNRDFVVLLGHDQGGEFILRRCLVIARETGTGFVEFFDEAGLPPLEYDVDYPSQDGYAVGPTTLWKLTTPDKGTIVSMGFLARDEAGTVFYTTVPEMLSVTHTGQRVGVREAVGQIPAALDWENDSKLAVTSRYLGVGAFADRHIIALRVKAAAHALPFAKQIPKRGDKVWVTGHPDNGQTLCMVLVSDGKRLVISGEDPEGSETVPGCCVTNLSGEVVGSVITTRRGLVFAAPVPALLRVLKQPAVPAKP